MMCGQYVGAELEAGHSEHSFCVNGHHLGVRWGNMHERKNNLYGDAVGTKMSGRYNFKQGGRSSEGLSAKQGSAERVQVDDF